MDIGCKDEFQVQLMNKMFIQTSTDFLIISLHVQSSFLTNHFLKLSRNLLNIDVFLYLTFLQQKSS